MVLPTQKKITEKKCEYLYQQIITQAKAYTIVEISPQQIDELNILQAILKAMYQVADNLKGQFDKVLVDGNKLPN